MDLLICPDGISPCALPVTAWWGQVMMRAVPWKRHKRGRGSRKLERTSTKYQKTGAKTQNTGAFPRVHKKPWTQGADYVTHPWMEWEMYKCIQVLYVDQCSWGDFSAAHIWCLHGVSDWRPCGLEIAVYLEKRDAHVWWSQTTIGLS